MFHVYTCHVSSVNVYLCWWRTRSHFGFLSHDGGSARARQNPGSTVEDKEDMMEGGKKNTEHNAFLWDDATSVDFDSKF